MIKVKHLSREVAIQSVYQATLLNISFGEALDNVLKLIEETLDEIFDKDFENTVMPEVISNLSKDYKIMAELEKYAHNLLLGIDKYRENFMDFLVKNDNTRNSDRFDYAVLAVLLVAMYEIEFAEDIDFPVAVNEAVEFCKKYSDEKSKGYVNSVLQAFADVKEH
ncbi:MAG: hypothetical protein KBT47_08685 [Armatimonadetes bacterium]|nr:hypothetical protein [Candidatus Hippobium faecium]